MKIFQVTYYYILIKNSYMFKISKRTIETDYHMVHPVYIGNKKIKSNETHRLGS